MSKRVTYNLYQGNQIYEYYDEDEYDEMTTMYMILKEKSHFDDVKVEKETVVLEKVEIEDEEKDFKQFIIDLVRENKSLKNEIEELERSYDNVKSELRSRPSGFRDNY